MGRLELPQDFKECLKLLKFHGVKYLLKGIDLDLIDLENLKPNKAASGR